MLSRAETDFLRGEKQAKPNQLRYLKHCVRRKIRALRENDLPAIIANEWARDMFQAVIGNNNGCAIESSSASETLPLELKKSSGSGRIRTGDLRRVRAASYRVGLEEREEYDEAIHDHRHEPVSDQNRARRRVVVFFTNLRILLAFF